MSKTNVVRAGLAAGLVPLAVSCACLACAPAPAWAADGAATAAAGETATAAATASEKAPAGLAGDSFEDGALAFGGVGLTLPEGMEPRLSGLQALAGSADDGLVVTVEKASFLTAPEGSDLAAAFEAASAKAVSGWSASSVRAAGTRDLGQGAVAYLFEAEVSGPYESQERADGTTASALAEGGGDWSLTQAYVALPTGGFTLVQVATPADADEAARARAEAVLGSLALAVADDKADGQADEKAALPEGTADAGGFTFKLPQGLEGSDGVWLGTTDDVLVERCGTLVQAADAASLTDEGVKAVLASAAGEMGAELVGSSARELASGVTVQVGVFSLASGSQSYECVLVLVPVADGSYEGLMGVLDPAAASSWAGKMAELVDSIEVVPAAQDAQAGQEAQAAAAAQAAK